MRFDVICGNPPYARLDGGYGASASPLYHLFVDSGKSMDPEYMAMIIPSRWMTGGKGLDQFRQSMMHDRSIIELHDYVLSKWCFDNTEIKGGICYFLRKRGYIGDCRYYRYAAGRTDYSVRSLNSGIDVVIREPVLIRIYDKVKAFHEDSLSRIVSATRPYGLRAETMRDSAKYGLPEFSDIEIPGGYRILGIDKKQHRVWKYISADYPIPKISQCWMKYKVFVSKAYGSGNIGERMAPLVLAAPGDLCTESYLEIGPVDTIDEALSIVSYVKTKFCRALVCIYKTTQDATAKVYQCVPIQDFSKPWTDEELYAKYRLSREEIDFIESVIKPMS